MAMLNRSERRPSQCSAMSRWPVLEIGRNSVMPSMTPSSRAYRRSMRKTDPARGTREDTRAPHEIVTPAQAGAQLLPRSLIEGQRRKLGPGLRRDDDCEFRGAPLDAAGEKRRG